MKMQIGSSFAYGMAMAAFLVVGSPSVAVAQSCAQLCRSDPTYKIMNQAACLRAKLTGSCTGGGQAQPRPDEFESQSRDRPGYYRSLGLPGDFDRRPPAERRRIAEDTAFSLLEKQQHLLRKMENIADTTAQSDSQFRLLRKNFNEAQADYDNTNRKLQELRRVYERDR